jgi:hypothetical protein
MVQQLCEKTSTAIAIFNDIGIRSQMSGLVSVVTAFQATAKPGSYFESERARHISRVPIISTLAGLVAVFTAVGLALLLLPLSAAVAVFAATFASLTRRLWLTALA